MVKTIRQNESSVISLDLGIPLSVSAPTYICVSVSSPYAGFEDLDPLNNASCLTIEPSIVIEDAFPNPVVDQFQTNVIVPQSGDATLELINTGGKVELSQSVSFDEGLNQILMNIGSLDAGMYFMVLTIDEERFVQRILKVN